MTEYNDRNDFPLLQKNQTIYLDNAATAQKPAVVIEAEKKFYEESNANPLRGFYPLSLAATKAYEDARKNRTEFHSCRVGERDYFYQKYNGKPEPYRVQLCAPSFESRR